MDYYAYCDGSNHNNQDGYGIVIADSEEKVLKEISRTIRESVVTNNIAELIAIREATKEIVKIWKKSNPEGEGVLAAKIMSDSKYAIMAVTQWYDGWVINGWLTAEGSKVSNQELITETRLLLDEYPCIELQHVKGHNGHVWNHLADILAGQWRYRVLEEQVKSSKSAEAGDTPRLAASVTSDDQIKLKLVANYQQGLINRDVFIQKLDRLLKKGTPHDSI
jgi:ribonuclease HI